MNNKSIRNEIILMEKGDHLTYSIDKVAVRTIYNYSCELGMIKKRKFMTKLNSQARTITISRLA